MKHRFGAGADFPAARGPRIACIFRSGRPRSAPDARDMERLLSHPGLGFSWVTAFKPVSLPGAGSAPASFGVSAPEKTVGRNGAARTSFHPLPPGFAPGPLIVIAMMSPTIRSRREEAFQDD